MVCITFWLKKKKLLEILDLWQQKYTSGIIKCREDELYVTGSMCLAQFAVSKKGQLLRHPAARADAGPAHRERSSDKQPEPTRCNPQSNFCQGPDCPLDLFSTFWGLSRSQDSSLERRSQSAHLKKWRWRWGRAVGGFCGWQADQSQLDRRTKSRGEAQTQFQRRDPSCWGFFFLFLLGTEEHRCAAFTREPKAFCLPPTCQRQQLL